MSKRIEEARKNVDANKVYKLADAIDIIKNNAKAKFDETVELHIKLGIDTKKADQQVRSTITLPNGTGKTKKIFVVAKGEKAVEAKEAGADRVGLDDIIEDVKQNKIDFDVLVATPDAMKELASCAKILGPRGLMPNPKSGTVTFELKNIVKELKAGRIEFKADAYGIIHSIFGKASFDAKKLEENARALIDAVIKAKPTSVKGVYVKSISISSTMGPGTYLDINQKF